MTKSELIKKYYEELKAEISRVYKGSMHDKTHRRYITHVYLNTENGDVQTLQDAGGNSCCDTENRAYVCTIPARDTSKYVAAGFPEELVVNWLCAQFDCGVADGMLDEAIREAERTERLVRSC